MSLSWFRTDNRAAYIFYYKDCTQMRNLRRTYNAGDSLILKKDEKFLFPPFKGRSGVQRVNSYSFYLSMGNELIGTNSLLKGIKQNCKLQK